MARMHAKPTLVAYPAMLWMTVCFALLGSFQFGYHLGILNTSLYWLTKDLDLDFTSQGATVVSAVLVGAVLGSLFAGQAADALGPKKALAINNAWLVAGCILCAAAPGGYWGILAGAFICVGILLAYLVGLPYQHNEPQQIVIGSEAVSWWRIMFLFGIAPAVLQAVGLLFTPESPVWLHWKGRRAAALYSEHQLLGSLWREEGEVEADGGAADEEEPLRPNDQENGEEAVHAAQGGWGSLLKARYRRIMILAAGLPLLQQASGINTVVFYSSDVFAKAGLESPVIGSIIVGSVNVAGTLLAAMLMDRAGRRQLLLSSHTFMAICLTALSVSTFLPLSPKVEGAVSLVAVMGFVLGFSMGSGPIPWVYLPEVLPNEIKGPAAALCTSLNWLSNLIVGLTFPSMLALLHVGGSYLVYAGLNIFGAVFVGLLMVETKQRSLAQIQEQLIRRD